MQSVFLIGAGQLGSRYLQGLSEVVCPLSITVVDPSLDSLSIAKGRFGQAGGSTPHNIRFTSHIPYTPQQIDLALVVTPAHCRHRVVKELESRHNVKSWVLEKVLAQSCEQLDQIERILASNNSVWVNTPRRLMSWYQRIRSQLVANDIGPIHVEVIGGSWGLACNAIHFIDLVSWWTNARVDYVDNRSLDFWESSKRDGFQEAFGTLLVTFVDGSSLKLNCNKNGVLPRIQVGTRDGNWLIDESLGKAVGPSGQEISGQLSFQSVLTAPLVEQILATAFCDLPSLSDSANQHRPFLRALLQHWNRSQSREDLVVPIT